MRTGLSAVDDLEVTAPTLDVAPGRSPAPVRTLFMGSGYAGHRTRFENLRRHVEADPRLDASWCLVTGWNPEGWLERTPGIPRGLKGRVRATAEMWPLLSRPRPDVIWSSAGSTDLSLLAWSFGGPMRRPFVLDLDWTLEQREAFAPWDCDRPPRSGLLAAVNQAREAAVWRSVTVFTPWSEWAAEALRRGGVDDSRIRVLPPGVDVDYWQPGPVPSDAEVDPLGRPLRLLFVGGDFRRKGGELLLEVMRGPLGQQLQLDIVTRETVEAAPPGVIVHRLNPNTPELRELYQRADLFVLPSLAECFGIATIEAMASGLPALVSDRGASREIVQHGRSGWLVEPTVQDLSDRLTAIVRAPAALPGMGAAARAIAVEKFNGQRNDARVVELISTISTPRPPREDS